MLPTLREEHPVNAATPQFDLEFSRRSPHHAGFFNTAALKGERLARAVSDARKQDVLVLTIFRGEKRPLSPSEVWTIGNRNGSFWLLTSVRRSINTMTLDGVLTKCVSTIEGPFGRPEHLWMLAGAP